MNTVDRVNLENRLRAQGCKVMYRHNRPVRTIVKMDGSQKVFEPKRGFTEVVIYSPNGDKIASGFSSCCSLDNYDRVLGNNIAMGRASKGLRKIMSNYLPPKPYRSPIVSQTVKTT